MLLHRSSKLHKFIYVLFALTERFVFKTRLPTCDSMSSIRNWRKPWTGPIAQVRSCHRHWCEQLHQRPVDTTMKWHCLSKVSRHQATSSFSRCREYLSAGFQLLYMTTSSSSSLWFLLWPWSSKRDMHFLVQSGHRWKESGSGWGAAACWWLRLHLTAAARSCAASRQNINKNIYDYFGNENLNSIFLSISLHAIPSVLWWA